MKITLIVAHDNNLAIGKNGDLAWHLPNDLKWFKQQTLYKPVVMGRTTWESIPKKYRPLTMRTNLVMTTNKNYKANGAFLCHSTQDVLTVAIAKDTQELMITGGAEIYRLFYPLADELIITEVNTTIEEADAHFVDYRDDNWYTHFEEKHQKDAKHNFDYTFKILKREVQ